MDSSTSTDFHASMFSAIILASRNKRVSYLILFCMVAVGLSFTSVALAAVSFLWKASQFLPTPPPEAATCNPHWPDEPVQVVCNCETSCEQEIRCSSPEPGVHSFLLGAACGCGGFSVGLLTGVLICCRSARAIGSQGPAPADLPRIANYGDSSRRQAPTPVPY